MQIRAAAAAVLTAATVAALTGCAPTHGRIHDKHFTPGYTSMSTTCMPAGKTTMCTSHPVWHPDEYAFDLYASKDDHGWLEVDQVDYHRYRIGDYYGADR